MADFNKAFEVLKRLEYRDCKNALHKNDGEDGWTFMGVYQKAHSDSQIWQELKTYQTLESDPEVLSAMLYNNANAQSEVKSIYKREYWDKAKLDKVKSQKIAEEIFVFGVNAGMERAIKLAQKIVGVKADGIVGDQTLKALNNYNDKLFDIVFDAGEAKYYESLVAVNERFKIFEDGWLNRAKAV